MKRSILVTLLLVSSTVCLAGYWEFELVDSGSLGSYVAIDKMSDGTIWLAYVNRDSAIRLAHKDTAWEYEDLDTSLVRPKFPTDYFDDNLPLSLDIGPSNVIGIVGAGRLAEHRDTGWSSEGLPMPMSGLSLSYDPSGRPSLTFKDSLRRGCLGLKTDSSWDTNVVYVNATGDRWWFSLSRPSWRRNDNCAFMEADEWSMGGLIDGYDVNLYTRDSGVWTCYTEAVGLDGGGCGFAALPDSSDSIHTFWSAVDKYFTNELVCDDVVLDSYTRVGAACLDDSSRVQCAWAPWSGGLKFGIPGHETWIVQDTGNPAWCDITTDALSEPVIAFCREDGSIWVAHGVGIVGLSDEQGGPVVRSLPRAVTIVSGVLVLGAVGSRQDTGYGAELLDISGRKVVNLHAGTNDVRMLAPGVYFVREGGESREQGGVGVRKVVVAR